MPKRKKKKKKTRRYHTGVHLSPKAGACRYRSGWEQLYMLHLDSDPEVVSYMYELIAIPYISNGRLGRVRNYYPDFLIEFFDGRKKLIEIKPKRKLSQRSVQKKLKAAATWCSEHGVTLEVVTEQELRSMGLLK